MKWSRYFAMLAIVFIMIFMLFNYNKTININNKKVSTVTRGIVDTKSACVRFKELYFMEDFLTKEIFRQKLSNILYNVEHNHNLRTLTPQFFKNEIFNSDIVDDISLKDNSILIYTYLLLDTLETNKRDLIGEIIKVQRQRDFVFLSLILFILSVLILEIKRINKSNKNVSSYLNNLIYKNYNFDIEPSPLPYISSTLEEIAKVRDNLNIIDKAIHVTLKGFSLSGTLNEIFHNEDFRKYLKFDRIGFATVEEEHFVADISISESNFLRLKRGFKVKKSESKSLMKIMNSKKVRIINDLESYYERHPNSDSTRLILEEGYHSSLTAPLVKSDGKIVGILFFSSKEKNIYREEDIYKVSSILDLISTIFEKNMLIEDLVTNSVLTFVKLVEGKDPETSNHVERMAFYSKIISKYLSLNPKYKDTIDYYFIDNILKFAPLHDIGKVGIPDNILLKPGRLTEEEFDIMKNHPKIGAKILAHFHYNLHKYGIDVFKMAVQLTVGHHEKWDGSGYPSGIRGLKIPLPARITAVADVFDAISSKRVYKEAFSFEKSIEIIKEMKGSHFDPDVVEAFIDGLPEIKNIYEKLKEV